MIYFCDKCTTFLGIDVVWRTSDYYPVCPQCREYVRACSWYLAGLRRFPALVKERINIDTLFKRCATCKSKFSCWTE